MAILDVKTQAYNHPLSAVFGTPEKIFAQILEDDADPLVPELRTINYRYVRFFYHPFKVDLSSVMGGRILRGPAFEPCVPVLMVMRRTTESAFSERTSLTLSKSPFPNCS